MNAITRIHPRQAVRQNRKADVLPSSFNEADNSVEVCWTTGAIGLRFDWFDGEYYLESLEVEPSAIRLERLNAGAPLLAAHNDRDLAAIVGSVVPGSVRIAGGQGHARVRLADTEDVATVVAKVKAGHIRSVSVGYMVHEYKLIELKDGPPHELRAVDWEPVELSLVAVPFDAGAKIRSEELPMNARTASLRGDNEAEQIDDRLTAKFIRDNCRNLGFSADETFEMIELFDDDEATRADFLQRAIELSVKKRQGKGITRAELVDDYISERAIPSISNSDPYANLSEAARLAKRMQGAVYARLSGKAPAEECREFAGASILDMGRGLLIARGEKAQFLSPNQVWQRFGAHTTSDFTQLLGGALNSFLTEQYAAAASPLMQLAKAREVADFREIKALSIAGSGELLIVEENAEYSYGTLGESGEAYQVHTFGRILSLSRQLIINDNLGALAQAGGWYVRAAGQKRADIIVALIAGNVLLADGKGIFHADHGNLAAVGTAITVASLSAARKAMRAQKDRDGITIIDVAPKYLVVGPNKETEAEQVLADLASASPTEVNPFSGKLTLLVDPRLIGNAWYLFAEPSQAPVIEYATLIGQGDSVYTDTRMGFEVDAVETKARIDFGAGAIDYRGAYKNPGE